MKASRNAVASVLLSALVTAGAAAPAPGDAAQYPDRPVRLIVPFPPGGSTDFNARAIQDRLSENLGQQLVIDNRGGASGTIGTQIAARSTPDGYTLLLHTLPFINSPILYGKNAGYDPLADFAPVALVSTAPMAISVNPAVPVRSVNDLLALAKSKPGALNYASAGIGTNSHITGELFNLLGRTSIVPIHFKGGGPAIAAVVSGEVQVGFSNVAQTSVMAAANRLRPIAVSSLKRSSAMPDVPTVAESGLPGFEFVTWHGVLAPKGTPAALVAAVNRRIRATLADPVVLKRFDKGGLDVVTGSPQEFAAYLKAEQAKWQRVIRERNIKAR